MSRAHCLSLLVAMIVVLLLLMSLEVQAQSTVDDDDSCQSTTLEEVVNMMRADIKEDLAEVKNLLGSRHQHFSAVDSSSLCEYKIHSLLEFSCVGLAYAVAWEGFVISGYNSIENGSASIARYFLHFMMGPNNNRHNMFTVLSPRQKPVEPRGHVLAILGIS